MSAARRLLVLCSALLFAMPALANDKVDFFRAIGIDNDVAIRPLLAQKRIDPNAIDPDRGEPALIVAARENAERVFALLLAQPGIRIDVKAANGDTPIMIAAYKGNYGMVRALLEREAPVNRPGWTALHYAAAGGHRELVALLLEKHAYIDAESPNRTTPLMMAARDNHVGVLKMLLEEGADPTLKNSQGMTAYDFAVYYQHKDAARLLADNPRRRG